MSPASPPIPPQGGVDGSGDSTETDRKCRGVAPTDEFAALTDAERQAWQQAVESYRDKLVTLDLLFNSNMVFSGNQLAAATALTDIAGERLPTGWLKVLQNAAPVYERHWWPRHDRANREWIDDVVPRLQRLAPLVAPGLARSYNGFWPETPVRVEVSYYANWAGAYTDDDPMHITLASSEIDHQTALDRLVAALARAGD